MYIKLRGYAKLSFENFAEIERTYCPTETGVKLLYGHIQSDSFDELKNMVTIFISATLRHVYFSLLL